MVLKITSLYFKRGCMHSDSLNALTPQKTTDTPINVKN